MTAGSPRLDGLRAGIRGRDLGWLAAAALVAAVGALGTTHLLLVALGVVAAGCFVLAVRHPGWTILLLVLALGLRIPLLGVLYQQGTPATAVRATSFVKEALLAAVIVAAVSRLRGSGGLDRIERVALAFTAAVTAYLVLTVAAPRLDAAIFTLAPESLSLQLFAYRSYVAGVVLALAVRRLGLDRRARRRIVAAVAAVGVLLAAGALLQQLRPELWTELIQDHVGLRELQRDIYGIERDTVIVRTAVAGREVVRAGSLLFDFLQLGFVLLPALAVALVGLGRRVSWWSWVAAAVLGVGVAATMSRAAMIGAAVVLAVVLLRHSPDLRRVRVVAIAVVGAVATGVLLSSGDLLVRLSTALDPDAPITGIHLESLARGAEAVAHNPLGHGLGINPNVAAFSDGASITSENAYLQLAVEMGVGVLLLFLALLAATWQALWRRAGEEATATAALAALAGVAVGALFLHVWTMLTATWILWLLIALALPRETGPDDGAPAEPGRTP